MTNEELLKTLCQLSDSKLTLMNTLLQFTKKQKKAIDEKDTDQLNIFIKEKQEIIQKIDALDLEFIEKYETLKFNLGITNFQDIQEEPLKGFKPLQEKVFLITNVIREIHKLEQENEKKLKENMEEVKKQLKSVRVGKKVTSVYNNKYMENPSIFIDKKE